MTRDSKALKLRTKMHCASSRFIATFLELRKHESQVHSCFVPAHPSAQTTEQHAVEDLGLNS